MTKQPPLVESVQLAEVGCNWTKTPDLSDKPFSQEAEYKTR